jgi:CHAT domain-containing protein/Tfp pilus assembly protein PilF
VIRDAGRRSAVIAALVCTGACREMARQPPGESSAFGTADSLALEGRAASYTPRYLALRDSFAVLHDSASWWRAQLWLAEGLLRQGKRDSGLVELSKASLLATGNQNRIGWTRYIRSIFMDRVGHFDSALTEASSAAAIAKKTDDPKLAARAYHAMGRIHSLSGRYRDALASNQRALEIENGYGATLRETSLELNELGIDYRHLGRFTDAVAAYDSALKIGRQLGNPEGIARVEFNLATILMATGESDRALTLLTDALGWAEQIGEVRGVAFIHGGLADLYYRAHAYKAAREHFQKALAINRVAKLPYGEVQNLEGIGRVDLAEGHPAQALPTLLAALAIADSAPYGQERASTRSALARATAATGAKQQALKWADQAVRIADSLGDPAAQLEARSARAVALEIARNSEAAAGYLSAINLLESWRGRLTLGDLRMGVADSHLEVYEGAIRSLLARGRSEEAFQTAERARARLLLELMAEHDVRNARRSREDTLRQALREKFASREDAKGPAAVAVDREIDSLTRSLDALEKEARIRDARAGVAYPASASITELRAGLVQPGRALLMYFWGEHDVYGWWMTSGTIRAAKLGSADSLSAMLEFLRSALSAYDAGRAWQPAAKKAFERLVSPLHPSPAHEILVVPDGSLAYLPLETFIPAGSTPWGTATRFTYGPSASVLLALQRASPTGHWTKGVLAVGNPARTGTMRTGVAAQRERSADSLLPDLPAAATEARNIALLLGGDAITGTQATLTHWLSLDPARYRYLHFATHTLFNDEHPQRTALMMADGSLDLDGVRRLRLSSDLVTLSACETALGQQLRGEGVIGFPHAFLEAGAHGVVMSLWRVSDQVAASYMQEFYRELRAGHSASDAMLTIRQRRIARGGSSAHPSEWAPFVLVGGFSTLPP